MGFHLQIVLNLLNMALVTHTPCMPCLPRIWPHHSKNEKKEKKIDTIKLHQQKYKIQRADSNIHFFFFKTKPSYFNTSKPSYFNTSKL